MGNDYDELDNETKYKLNAIKSSVNDSFVQSVLFLNDILDMELYSTKTIGFVEILKVDENTFTIKSVNSKNMMNTLDSELMKSLLSKISISNYAKSALNSILEDEESNQYEVSYKDPESLESQKPLNSSNNMKGEEYEEYDE